MTSASATLRDLWRCRLRCAWGVLLCLVVLAATAAAQESNEPAEDSPAAAGELAPETQPPAAVPAAPAEQPQAEPTPPAAPKKPVRLVRVPLPIVGNADTQVIAAARNAIAAMPAGNERPVLVLEFSSTEKQAGAGSDFERSLKLARFLSSRETSGVETVAYIPEGLKGHAVLAAMACESIVMGPEAVLGEAGIDEPAEQTIDPTVRSGYREIANRRRTVPAEVALAMLDKNLELLKVETEVSPEYVLSADLPTLQKKHAIQSQKVLSSPGQFMLLTGSEARAEGFAKYLAANRAELARALAVPANELQDDPSLWGDWRPVQIAVEGPITPSLVSSVERTIEKEVREHQVNLVILRIESLGGSLTDSLRLAHVVAEQDPARVQVIAYVPSRALSDAALVALAADQLVMHHDAVLGGEGDAQFAAEDLELARESLRDSLAPLKHRGWSMMAALYDPEVRVFEYTHRQDGSRAYFSPQERGEQRVPDDWVQGPEVTGEQRPLQINGDRAVELGLARHAVQNFGEFKQQYGLEGEVQLAELGWADYLIQALAAPTVAWILLLIGGAALYAELQSPGIGIGAFVSGVAFLLYFWSKHLGGTADWLEVLLFTAGVCFVLLELFVLPGTAIFGLGGGLLIIASLVLASQTFVVPHNEYQLAELRDSLLSLFAAGVGIGVLAMLMQRYLPHTPLLNNMMLDPPSGAELEDLSHRESLVSFEHLLGVHGVAATQLTPSGKARFGNKLVDVIASGEVIARGEPIVVTEVHGNRVVVRTESHG